LSSKWIDNAGVTRLEGTLVGGGGSQPGVIQSADFLITDQIETLPIVAVDDLASPQTVTVNGDQTAFLPAGRVFAINGSTGNDALDYSVLTATFGAGVTVIELDSGVLSSAVADGDVVAPQPGTISGECPVTAGTTVMGVGYYMLQPALEAVSGFIGDADLVLGDSDGADVYDQFSNVQAVLNETYDGLDGFNAAKAFFLSVDGPSSPGNKCRLPFVVPQSDSNNAGYRYASDDSITLSVELTYSSLVSVTPGTLLVKIWYCEANEQPVTFEPAA
jgi:hypothetical protein